MKFQFLDRQYFGAVLPFRRMGTAWYTTWKSNFYNSMERTFNWSASKNIISMPEGKLFAKMMGKICLAILTARPMSTTRYWLSEGSVPIWVERQFSLKRQDLQIMRVNAFDFYTCRLCYWKHQIKLKIKPQIGWGKTIRCKTSGGVYLRRKPWGRLWVGWSRRPHQIWKRRKQRP